jgi:hypothetical protein
VDLEKRIRGLKPPLPQGAEEAGNGRLFESQTLKELYLCEKLPGLAEKCGVTVLKARTRSALRLT